MRSLLIVTIFISFIKPIAATPLTDDDISIICEYKTKVFKVGLSAGLDTNSTLDEVLSVSDNDDHKKLIARGYNVSKSIKDEIKIRNLSTEDIEKGINEVITAARRSCLDFWESKIGTDIVINNRLPL